jgi:Heterokaryon incompatibility protein (HET)
MENYNLSCLKLFLGHGPDFYYHQGESCNPQDEIPFERLPRTIKDAITITRDLGIQFLLVDALYIVQHSLNGEDWQRESAKMESIYGNAYVTIAAEISENCTD